MKRVIKINGMMKDLDIMKKEFDSKTTTLSSDCCTIIPNNTTVESVSVLDEIWDEVRKLKRSTPAFVELSCKNCGAKIQQKYEDQIIKCPYCKSVYIIGTWRVNDSI